MKEMFAMDSEKGKVVFHDLCDLGAAVINNQIDVVEELIGWLSNLLWKVQYLYKGEGCSVNYNGTKVVWKDGYGKGLDKEMEGVTPLMLAIMFLSTEHIGDMAEKLMMTDESIGKQEQTLSFMIFI